ncbi:unnamed protein product, partial [Discosporangium mesarthrocarpum]
LLFDSLISTNHTVMVDFMSSSGGEIPDGLEHCLRETTWANIQPPVRMAFEATLEMARRQGTELRDARTAICRLESRLSGMEEEYSHKLNEQQRDMQVEMDSLRQEIGARPGLGAVQAAVEEVSKVHEKDMDARLAALEKRVSLAREEGRVLAEGIRRDSAGKASLLDLESLLPRKEAATRADLQEFQARLLKKSDAAA